MENTIKAPWLSHYGEVKFNLEYPEGSMSDAVYDAANKYPDYPALSFMGKYTSYKALTENIETAERAFSALGVKPGDTVTLCMPNVPQAIYCLYALNRMGAIASMVHPLSAEGEIVYYLKEASCDYVVTLDQFYGKFMNVIKEYPVKKIVFASVGDALGGIKKIGYALTQGRKIEKVESHENILSWKDFIAGAALCKKDPSVKKDKNDPAVILFSGGTTGVTKGIMLSNLNFNALAYQTANMCNKTITGHSMLAAMPIFHGFCLGVCIHTILVYGAKAILVPRFNVRQYAKLLKTEKPNFIAGVPTLYEAITRNPYMDKVDLSCLMGVFSGGDSLSVELKKKFDKFLADHGATVRVREGYGATECVTASCLTPYNEEREGSIGLPYPDTYYKICAVGTNDEVPYGTEGEICLTGPSVMLGYLNHPEENANTLRKHEDGKVWLHTGDLGLMDSDGFIYFKQRIKRMIITSGYNVYPSQLENILDAFPAVQMSCVIGIPDPYKMQKIKAFVTLRDGYEPSPELGDEIYEYCKKRIAKYAMPYDIEFRDSLPKTLVGKVAYTVLEKEEAERRRAEEAENEGETAEAHI